MIFTHSFPSEKENVMKGNVNAIHGSNQRLKKIFIWYWKIACAQILNLCSKSFKSYYMKHISVEDCIPEI